MTAPAAPHKRHLLTGAGSGIGAALARQLVERGDSLVLLARSEVRAAGLREQFPAAEVLVADLAQPGTLNGLARQVDGPVDSVLHVAGVVSLGSVARLKLDDLQHQLDVNLVAPTILTREFLPKLRETRGSLVFVNSTAGLTASPDWAGYAASKWALRAVADVVRAEEREHGVAVTTVYPSRTATPMQESVHAQEGRTYVAAHWSAPETVARAICQVLDLPADSSINELTIRPR